MTSAVATPAALARRPAILIGLVGEGVTPSLTPPMHEFEGARHGMHYVYRPIDLAPSEGTTEWLENMLVATRRFGFNGLNITHPVKQAIVPLLDGLADSARIVGAVNTVVFTDDGAIGHNTDVTGFRAALRDAFGDERPGRAVLLGAGGAGSALATALADGTPDELVIVDADPRRAEALAARVANTGSTRVVAAPLDALATVIADAGLVVNATPVGMAAHPGLPFDPALLPSGACVADIVYRPVDTELLTSARTLGIRTMSGLGMAMHQAADAFEIFTGARSDRASMLRDLDALVAAESAGAPHTRIPTPARHRGENQ